MQKKRGRSIWYVVLVDVVVAALAALRVLVPPSGGATLYIGLRIAALTGFVLVYLSILSSLFLRELVKALGQPFVKLHHFLSVAALVLVTLHPLGWAVYSGSARAILPSFASVATMQTGPLIWLLLVFALAAALLRKKLTKWRIVHWLTYLAFLGASFHAWIWGSNTQSLGMRIVIALMAASVVGAFIWKRLKMRKKPARSPSGRVTTASS
jgi:methionine sulfoxide reductase heme-binding subunit